MKISEAKDRLNNYRAKIVIPMMFQTIRFEPCKTAEGDIYRRVIVISNGRTHKTVLLSKAPDFLVLFIAETLEDRKLTRRNTARRFE